MKTKNNHVLYTKEDFTNKSPEEMESDTIANLVLDGGLTICKVCGEFEAGLDKECKPKE
ncbi:hypothetical protein [Bacillus thuringiensis]|uniref:hypothetical protein n=1 Tax=Bacillus thuringiensis TaxID=1428 RepID=UPI001483AAE6|nr:hypothetical protein [Bacillus thuringiensis]